MALYISREGRLYANDQVVARSGADSWQIGLYINLLAQTDARTLADFSPATFAGYAPVAIGTFDASTIDAGERARAVPHVNSFAFQRTSTGAAQAVIGYYVFSGSTLLGFEPFGAPFTFSLAGDTLTLTFARTEYTDAGPV